MDIDAGTRAIIKETAREVIAEYRVFIEREMAEKIELHAAQCSAKKYANGKNFFSAVIGGSIVAFFAWLWSKVS